MRLFGAIIFLFGIFFAFSAQAASLNFSVEKTVVAIGDQFSLEARVDSEGAGINVSQATITFPKNLLEVVKVDHSDSAFNFWLQEPAFSNDKGEITFLGGATNGLTGQSLKVLTITLKAKASGEADLAFTDAAIIASDGSGTNLFSSTKGAKIDIGETRQPGAPAPAQITRETESAKNLPIAPQIIVALYPNQSRWYNVSGNFLARWNLPADISEVVAIVDKNKSTEPVVSEGLFDHKEFSALNDGIFYLHVRFKNSIGWGATAHYRIAIDRAPPKPFDIKVDPGLITDNPSPVFQFRTSDALSGLKEYQIRIGKGDLIKISLSEFQGNFKLPLQPPGKNNIVVKAIDEAGNSVESSVDLEITPIESPKITFTPKEIFSDEERGFSVRGTSLLNGNILLKAYWQDTLAFESTVRSDEKGNWEFTFDNPLKNGIYKIIAQAQDERGALSLPVESNKITAKSKPIIQIGSFQLGSTGAIIFLLVVILIGFGSGVLFYKKRQEKIFLRVLLSEAEIAKAFALIQADLRRLEEALKTPAEIDDQFLINKLKENISKMEYYLKKGVEKIKK